MDLEALEVLRSIDASLKALLALTQRRTAHVLASQPKAVATDRDLDGKHGNPVLKFMPRDWTGPSYKQVTFSECPPELLDLVADTLDYFGDKAERENERTNAGKPVAVYKRADAARARGWAKRIRAGTHVPRHPGGTGVTEDAGDWTESAIPAEWRQ